MCVDHTINCSCGKDHASFNFRDEILPVEVIAKLHCPVCSQGVRHDPATMLADNGWIIGFDMDVARFMLSKAAPVSQITPEFVFDEGYCTWRGVTPSDHIDSVRERETLAQFARTDRKRYFEEIKVWAKTRMDRLAREGWRKAHEREAVGT